MNCACKSDDEYDCWALRYKIPFEANHDDIRREGGPCECYCHYCDDQDAEEWEAGK